MLARSGTHQTQLSVFSHGSKDLGPRSTAKAREKKGKRRTHRRSQRPRAVQRWDLEANHKFIMDTLVKNPKWIQPLAMVYTAVREAIGSALDDPDAAFAWVLEVHASYY